uniref:Serine/threonine-protein kinase haspin n=1 Tax=Fundulus heteroclitus TaxID=8078 RepID=A0A3Q2P487_FUNHE
MKPFKPLFLKTYGKQRRRLSAWISSDDRRKAFDSTPSSDDTSAFEAAKPSKTRANRAKVGRGNAERPAKTKAKLCLYENSCDEENMSDEENKPPASWVSGKTTRGKKRDVSSSKWKADVFSSESSRNEDVMKLPSLPAKRKKTTARGKKRDVSSSKWKADVFSSESSRNEDVMKLPSLPAKRKKTTARTSRLAPVCVDTRWRDQGVSSTNEFEAETSPPKRRKIEAKTKSDSSVRLPSAGRFITRRRRAASTKAPEARVSFVNSLDDFTSGPFGPSRNLQPSSRQEVPFKLSSSESSANATGSPFREISLNEFAAGRIRSVSRKPIFCSTPSAPSSNKRRCLTFPSLVSPAPECSSIGASSTFPEDPRLRREKQSLDLFSESDGGACSDGAESHGSDPEGGKSASVDLLSADGESGSLFTSAAAGVEWLAEALKERCLRRPCAVRLERLNAFPLSQLCGQTIYSSCLELSGPETEAAPRASAWTRTVGSPPEGSKSETSAVRESHLLSPELFYSSYKEMTGTQSPARKASAARLTDGEATAARSIRTKKCVILAEKLPPSVLRAFTLQREADMARSPHRHERTRGMVRLSESDRDPDARKGPETVSEAAGLTSEQRDKSLSSEALANGKDTSLSKSTKVRDFKPSTSASDSSIDRQSAHLADRKHSEDAASLEMASKSSSSGQEEEKSGRDSPEKDKRSLAHKERRRRSPSADRTGTTRKACVSGMSVSRWKSRGAGGAWAVRGRELKKQRSSTAWDCSIEMITKQPDSQELLDAAANLSTPLRTSRLNLSSLLANFTPSTHIWSRLKASLSIHHRSTVKLTPMSSDRAATRTPRRRGSPDQNLLATTVRTPLSRRLQSQLLSQHSLIVCDDLDLTDAEKVYAECGQRCPLAWEECILPNRIKRCVKIGEGTFGEVFSTTNAAGDTVALKIIPVEGSEKVNGENQKTFGEILHEIIISKELSSLKDKQQNQTPGFIKLHDTYCVQGCYPPDLLKAWDAFDRRKGSENDRPDFFEKDQLFIIFEFEFGGVDLENSNGKLASLVVAKSVLHQVTAALAVAEQELQFEHRDLHWGNVLVKTTKEKMGSFTLDGTAHSIETKGVLVRIIDYSLSRLEIDDLTVSCDISNEEELFMGHGDYQFEIYRLMRQENRNDWSSYHPHSNVLWLHYLCSKLLSMKYKNARGRGCNDARKELSGFYDSILQYSSATDALLNCPMFQ